MFGYSKAKIGFICAVLFLGVIFCLPNILPPDTYRRLPESVRSWFHPVTLGLDLQGGSYLLMELDTPDMIREKLETLADVVRPALREDRILTRGRLTVADGALTVTLANAAQVAEARDVIRRQESLPLDIETNGQTLTVRYTEKALEDMKRQAVDQSVDIVRRRIDELGTKEPQIQRQGLDRIVIQLPGVQDASEIESLLGETAKITFHLVNEEFTAEDARNGRQIPADTVQMTDKDGAVYYIRRSVIVGGESLSDARQSFGENGEVVVAFSFQKTGAKKFAKATSENVKRRLAIVLDKTVLSAPVINTPITDGSGIITGNFDVRSANELAVMIRSGALPARLVVAERRTVGPGLGEDSIRAGARACLIGLVAVVVFMLVVYGPMGIVADLTLLANGVLLFAALSLLGATLTLPGLAGIALTVGMAVDANILILERMKEEMLHGITVPAEVLKRGFKGSFSAILDGQLTTLFAALFLFWLGSGPVRGFGVTLGLGLATSLFAAIFVNKVILIAWMTIRKPKKLNF